MAQAWQREFYDSPQWRRCRESYLKSQGYICERCGDVATMVHHKVYLTNRNYQNAELSLGFGNLMAVCMECHNTIHHRKAAESRYIVDEHGRVILK